ncbi:uncharacterized protein N7500_008965 [Penicillium coprophilum]|uniref:uncharacterized protein n=1 Tax=Penicillium coprophilum TaxID=36646 RepID=UPI00239546D8|nr:uncharacterized protein N7500_008965 [Penicillium coprophilum]KAJ5159314.1 hypothetical protein N7500_008965 [Penicillium coprophilum]
MAPKTIRVQIRPRGRPIKNLPVEVQVASNASTAELYQSLADSSALSVHRLRVTRERDERLISNSKEITIEGSGLEDESPVQVKDLGPQISWRTVFIAEYLGPALMPALFLFSLRPYLYYNFDTIPEPTNLQCLVCALLTIHFLKRELESIFVHRFGNATMPLRNLFRNTGYYWVMAGLNIPYWVLRPDAATGRQPDSILLCTGIILFTLGELANLNTHLILRDLRRVGTTERGIPSGFGFSVVTCPNYFFEIVAWTGIYLISGMSWSILLPTIIGSVQMAIWARKKESRYREEFGDTYKSKTFSMIPGII